MRPRRFLLVLTVVVVALLMVIVWFYPSTEDFRADNPFWNGLEAFSEHFQASPIQSFSSLPAKAPGTALVVVPYLPFTKSELERLRSYVSLGGTLVLLDDYGYGNEICEYFGVKFRFTQGVLMDPVFNYRNKQLPTVTRFGAVLAGQDLTSLTLNHATSLSDVSDSEVLAWSSWFSYLDLNNNSGWDEGEPKGPLAVAAGCPVNEGYVVAVSDPSILINSMEGIEGSYAFIQSLVGIRYPQPQILVDQSHLPGARLDEAKGTLGTIRSWFSSPVGISALVLVILAAALSPLWRRKKQD